MALDGTLEQILQQYGALRAAQESFDRDSSTANTEARNLIMTPQGVPALEHAPGIAEIYLRENRKDTVDGLAAHVNDSNYSTIKGEIGLDNDKTAIAYSELVAEYKDIRSKFQAQAIKRVAAANNLDGVLTGEDANFANKSEDEKVAAYLGKIKTDDKMKKQLGEDKVSKATNALMVYYTLKSLVGKNKLDDAVAYASQTLRASIPAILKGNGHEGDAKALLLKIAGRQHEIGYNLMKEASVMADVEKAIAGSDKGYAKAAGELYSVKASEN